MFAACEIETTLEIQQHSLDRMGSTGKWLELDHNQASQGSLQSRFAYRVGNTYYTEAYIVCVCAGHVLFQDIFFAQNFLCMRMRLRQTEKPLAFKTEGVLGKFWLLVQVIK